MGILLGLFIIALGVLSGWMVDEYFGAKSTVFEKAGMVKSKFVADAGSVACIFLAIGGVVVGFIYTLIMVIITLEGMLS